MPCQDLRHTWCLQTEHAAYLAEANPGIDPHLKPSYTADAQTGAAYVSAQLKHHQRAVAERETYHQGQHAELQNQLQQAQHELRLSESTCTAELEGAQQGHKQQMAELQSAHDVALQVGRPTCNSVTTKCDILTCALTCMSQPHIRFHLHKQWTSCNNADC